MLQPPSDGRQRAPQPILTMLSSHQCARVDYPAAEWFCTCRHELFPPQRAQSSSIVVVRAAAFLSAALVVTHCGSSSRTATGPSPVKCQVSVSTSSSNLDASGGTGSIAVTTDPECTWTASTTASWISSLSPVSGQGTGRVEFRVPANPAPSMRQGEVTINGTNAIVRQDGSPCRFQINPATEIVEADGGTTTVSVCDRSGMHVECVRG